MRTIAEIAAANRAIAAAWQAEFAAAQEQRYIDACRAAGKTPSARISQSLRHYYDDDRNSKFIYPVDWNRPNCPLGAALFAEERRIGLYNYYKRDVPAIRDYVLRGQRRETQLPETHPREEWDRRAVGALVHFS